MNTFSECHIIVEHDARSALLVIDSILKNGQRMYALIDGAIDEEEIRIQEWFGNFSNVYLYNNTEMEEQKEVGPVLVTLPQSLGYFENYFMSESEKIPCLLFASDRTPEELQAFFRYRLEVKLENYNVFLFRFYDVNIVKPFIKSLSSLRAMKFFGPAATILWPVVNMHNREVWLCCEFPAMTKDVFQLTVQTLREQEHPCWEAMDGEWKSFEANFRQDVSLIDLCRYLLDRNAILLQNISDEEISKRVQSIVDLARSYDMTSQKDVYTFAEMELITYPGMHLHPQVDALLKSPAIFPGQKMYNLLSLEMKTWGEVQLISEEYLEENFPGVSSIFSKNGEE